MPHDGRQEISLGDAAKQLGVTRATLYYYMRTLNIVTVKYPLDKKAYIPMADFEKIKALKEKAKQRNSESEGEESVA